MNFKTLLLILFLCLQYNDVVAQNPASRQTVEPSLRFLPDADISKINRKFLDIPYADRSIFQKLDIFLPESGEGPFPVVVFIHGGAWLGCDKADRQVESFFQLLSHGYAVVSVNYRLSGEAEFPAGVIDSKAAIRFLKARAKDFKLNPEKIGVAGQSAGAHCALMLATTMGNPAFEDLSMGNAEQNSDILCVFSQYAMTDLTTLKEQYKKNKLPFPIPYPQDVEDKGSVIALMFGGTPFSKINPKRILEASPINLITSSMPPTLLQHGKVDGTVPYQQSLTFYNKALSIVGKEKVKFEIFDTATHADKQFETQANMEHARLFFDKYLK